MPVTEEREVTKIPEAMTREFARGRAYGLREAADIIQNENPKKYPPHEFPLQNIPSILRSKALELEATSEQPSEQNAAVRTGANETK